MRQTALPQRRAELLSRRDARREDKVVRPSERAVPVVTTKKFSWKYSRVVRNHTPPSLQHLTEAS